MKKRGKLLVSESDEDEELSASALYLDPSQKGFECPEFPRKDGNGLGPSDV